MIIINIIVIIVTIINDGSYRYLSGRLVCSCCCQRPGTQTLLGRMIYIYIHI